MAFPVLLLVASAAFARLPMSGMSSTAPIGTRRHIAMAAPRGRGPPPPEHMINEFIKSPELRVVGEPEEPEMPDIQLGVMSRSDALARAREEGVDLVCISPGASPPVCKIIDYGRYRFQVEKRKKMIKKVRARRSRRARTHNLAASASGWLVVAGGADDACALAALSRGSSRSPAVLTLRGPRDPPSSARRVSRDRPRPRRR